MSRRVLLGWLLVAAATLWVQSSWAQDDRLRRSMGNLRPPSDDLRRSMGNLRPSTPAVEPGSDESHGGRRGRHRDFGYLPGYYATYPYVDSYWVYPGWPAYPSYYPAYPPPLYLPPGTHYGPQATRRFLGWDQSPPGPAAAAVVAEEDRGDEPAAPPRGTSDRALALAWRFIGVGDAQFGSQKYRDAYQRYKRAAQSAPGLADVYFRQGLALMALGNYDLAARSFKRGIDLDAAWARSGFRLDELYGENQAAKTAHLETLAQAASNDPDNADLLFLVGVMLHFDGQSGRARPFFEEASRLGHAAAYSEEFLVDRPDEASGPFRESAAPR